MLLNTLFTLASTAAVALAAAETSPLFFLASTAEDAVTLDDKQTNPPASEVQQTLWRYLSSCPTKHYAVIVEPRVLSYPASSLPMDSFVPEPTNPWQIFTVKDVNGKVNINHVLNTILMDCLHHGVLTVEQLDTSPEALAAGIPELDADIIKKSIIYARMPEVDIDLAREEYASVMTTRKSFAESILRSYFAGLDYTFLYVREEELEAEGAALERGGGAEIPLGGSH